jgi:transposase-like protein
MKSGGLPPIGGEGDSVQMDETYFGTIDALRGKTWAEKKGHSKKMSVVTLVNQGKSRTFHVDTADAETVLNILRANVKKETVLHTDESRIYKRAGKEFAHETVRHAAGEYVRGDVHINMAENYFSIFKRGMRGVYQHCSEKHLQRYLDEFDFRYNRREIEDSERADQALQGIVGKRLTYRQSANRQEKGQNPRPNYYQCQMFPPQEITFRGVVYRIKGE